MNAFRNLDGNILASHLLKPRPETVTNLTILNHILHRTNLLCSRRFLLMSRLLFRKVDSLVKHITTAPSLSSLTHSGAHITALLANLLICGIHFVSNLYEYRSRGFSRIVNRAVRRELGVYKGVMDVVRLVRH